MFRFTTPTVKLLGTNWYRRGGTVDGRMVVLLRFNQRVSSADIASALAAALEPHDWAPPEFTPEALARLKPPIRTRWTASTQRSTPPGRSRDRALRFLCA